MKKKIDFEMWLVDQHASQYVGTDDDMVESCADWISDMSAEEIIDYANKWGRELVFRTKQRMHKDYMSMINTVFAEKKK